MHAVDDLIFAILRLGGGWAKGVLGVVDAADRAEGIGL